MQKKRGGNDDWQKRTEKFPRHFFILDRLSGNLLTLVGSLYFKTPKMKKLWDMLTLISAEVSAQKIQEGVFWSWVTTKFIYTTKGVG